MAEILKIVNLNKKFGNLEVLKDVNLSLNEGEILSVLGDSGCGKSTLLRIIAGLETPSGGQIAVKEGCGTDDVSELRAFSAFKRLQKRGICSVATT